MVAVLAALAAGYLLGSLPMAAWLARLRGKDVFKVGSGNMGAMNTARNLGMGLGILVLLLDVAKGAAATAAGGLIASLTLGASPLDPNAVGASTAELTLDPRLLFPLVAGFGAVLGHAFSMFVGFRGGKALATTLGVSLPLYPAGGAAGLVLIIALYLLTRRSGLAGALTMLAYPLVVFLALERSGWERSDSFAVATGVIPLVIVVLLKHISAWRRDGTTGNAA